MLLLLGRGWMCLGKVGGKFSAVEERNDTSAY